jgi:hypothetical protein
MGLEWGNSGKTFDQFGTITAQFAETKSGTAGGFSYVAIYGWSTNPSIDYYIIDDSLSSARAGSLSWSPGAAGGRLWVRSWAEWAAELHINDTT